VGITAKGYRRIYDPVTKRLRMEHDLVWERTHGPIPDGFQVHHTNEDKLDNRIANLELLDALRHKRLHSGCECRDGMWWKPCRKCGVMKPVTEYYSGPRGWILSWCKSCQIQNAVFNKRKRRAAKQFWLLLAEQPGKEATLDSDGRGFRESAGERQPKAA
jgi:HNH endonuclease